MAAQFENSQNKIMEAREELMVLCKGGEPIRRIGQFLKPCVTSIDGPSPPVFHLPQINLEARNFPLKVSFNGWRNPPRDWKTWVEHMHNRHYSIWQKAGIYSAVMDSTCKIVQHEELILRLAEKWSSETNTFVFPWGEATITLEDVMILGGYSVLGQFVSSPLENTEQVETLAKLEHIYVDFAKSRAKKVGQNAWLTYFMDSGSDIEHEAFLALWLSRFVFPASTTTIIKNLYPIAIHLARGTRIALAPAVLSGIYRDLRFLNQKIVESRNLGNGEFEGRYAFYLTLWSPLQFVQIWAWERFPPLRPLRNYLEQNRISRLARWDKKKRVNIENIALVIESAAESFCWRPYTRPALDSAPLKFYRDQKFWMIVSESLDEEYQAFARCMRVSELVGIDRQCIEQYVPHRVAMQFGMDQDLPGQVPRVNETPTMAWEFYSRPLEDAILYFPSRFDKPFATVRYLQWWYRSNMVARERDRLKEEDNDLAVPSICHRAQSIRSIGSGNSNKSVKPQMQTSQSSRAYKDINLNIPYVELEMPWFDESVAGTSAAVPQNRVNDDK